MGLGITPLATFTKGAAVVTKEEFRDVMITAVKDALKDYLGPQDYLMQRYGSVEAQTMYVKALWRLFPPMQEVTYELETDIKMYEHNDPGPPIHIHLAKLNFDPNNSPREPSSKDTCLSRVDQIMTDGFVTSTEPVMLVSGGKEQLLHRGNSTVRPP